MIYDIQKAGILKRFSAFLLDIILLLVLAAGFAFLMAWITQISTYTEIMQAYEKEYGEKYGVDLLNPPSNYYELPEEERDKYDEAWRAIFEDHPDAVKAYKRTTTLPFLIVTVSALMSFLILEFILPLILKNGQTVGKKVFNLGVVFNNSVKINTFALFVRSILGKYTIGTMFPVLLVMMFFSGQMPGLVAPILVGALVIFQIVLFFATKNRLFIHDTLANTVVVDMSSQMIFGSTAELVSYQEQVGREKAEKKQY